jgi:hypothetical protein
VVQKQFRDLVVSTYGRGIYVLDDVTPFEQMAQKVEEVPVRLFAPRETFRLFPNGGAAITYALRTAAKAPLKIEILDSNGAVIRKLDGPGRAGINRAQWNFLYDPPKLVALRTIPQENPHIWEERRFRGSDSRPILHWGIREAEVGPMALPGKYTVRLMVDGQSFTQPLTILKNPNVQTSDEDLAAAFKVQLRVRDDITKTSEAVNKLEWMRKQIDVIARMLGGRKSAPPATAAGERNPEDRNSRQEASEASPNPELLKSVEAMDQKMQDVEYKYISRADALSDDKYYSIPEKIYLQLIWLNGEVGTGAGDVAGGVDNPPTDTAAAILETIEKDLAKAQSGYQDLLEKELPAFNRSLLEKGITPIAFVRPASAADEEGEGN